MVAPGAGQPGVDIIGTVRCHVCQTLASKMEAYEFGPLRFVEGGGRNLLYGERQVEYTSR